MCILMLEILLRSVTLLISCSGGAVVVMTLLATYILVKHRILLNRTCQLIREARILASSAQGGYIDVTVESLVEGLSKAPQVSTFFMHVSKYRCILCTFTTGCMYVRNNASDVLAVNEQCFRCSCGPIRSFLKHMHMPPICLSLPPT